MEIENIKKCDMCGTNIQDGKCSCGHWYDAAEMKDNPFKLSLEEFNDMKQFVLTSDAPHLGCASVFFRGSYNDCQKVKNFIYEMNGRQYYKYET